MYSISFSFHTSKGFFFFLKAFVSPSDFLAIHATLKHRVRIKVVNISAQNRALAK